MHPPIPNSYWVEPARFAAGEYPGGPTPALAEQKLCTILAAGVDHFIDLTEADEGLAPYAAILARLSDELGVSASHNRFPIRDVSVPEASSDMVRILDAIDTALSAGRTVYLHCWGGVGRTGTTVGCWLVRHGRTGEGALAHLAELWAGVAKAYRTPRSPETREQGNYIRGWGEKSVVSSQLGNDKTPQDRFRGCLLGLAAGDALGTTLEFRRPGSFEPIVDMVGGGPFHLEPGQWTDDTSMALCLAESLIQCGGSDPADQMRRYVRWADEGYLSSNGRCFDIGNTVSRALARFRRTGDPFAGSTDPAAAGNGSLMRLAPISMFFAHDGREAIARAAESSRTTHGAQEAVDACRYYAGLTVGALAGVDKETLLQSGYSPVEGLWETQPLAEKARRLVAMEVSNAVCASTKAGIGTPCCAYPTDLARGMRESTTAACSTLHRLSRA